MENGFSDLDLVTAFGNRVRRFRYSTFANETGSLIPFELSSLPFPISRVFIVQAVDGAVRGGHAHDSGRQLLVCLSGKIEVELRLRGIVGQVILDPVDNAVLIEAPVWARQRYYGSAPSIIVFCDRPYDPEAYIRHDYAVDG